MLFDTLKTYNSLVALDMPEPQALSYIDLLRAVDATIRHSAPFDEQALANKLVGSGYTETQAGILVEMALDVIGLARRGLYPQGHEYPLGHK